MRMINGQALNCKYHTMVDEGSRRVHAGCLNVEARTLRGRLLPLVRDAAAQVRGMLLVLARERCAAATAMLLEANTALVERPELLQAFMEFQV